jgi:hypothetical protein
MELTMTPLKEQVGESSPWYTLMIVRELEPKRVKLTWFPGEREDIGERGAWAPGEEERDMGGRTRVSIGPCQRKGSGRRILWASSGVIAM